MAAPSVAGDFFANANGTSAADVLMATAAGPLSIVLTSLLVPLALPEQWLQLPFTNRICIQVLLELCTSVMPLLLSFTLLADWNGLFVALLVAAVVGLAYHSHAANWNGDRAGLELLAARLPETRPPFWTNYRAGIYLATCLCILAVDFDVFPRRFAKTDAFGFSLMDVGTGCFVVVGALNGPPQRAHRARTLMLAALGLVRLALLRLTGYHQRAGEYGTHWNFFFTLAAMRGAADAVDAAALRRLRPWTLAAAVAALHHVGLKLGLESWVLSDAPRDNLVSANREGLVSLVGYVALHFAAAQLGELLRRPRTTFKEWIQLSITLTSLSVAGWMILPYWQALLGRPSRMLANASYTFWVLTYNVTLLAAYSAADLVLVWLRLETGAVRPSDDGGGDDGGRRRNQRRRRMAALATREPYLMTCINGNGLVFFLTANVLTGLVNLVCRPVAMAPSAGVAFAVLTVYGALLGVPVVFMHLWKLKL